MLPKVYRAIALMICLPEAKPNKSMDHIILPLTLLMLEAVGGNMHMDWVIKVADVKSEVI